MTYDFDDPSKFEDDYDASAVKSAKKKPAAEFTVKRNDSTASKFSLASVASYVSNLSILNKNNLGRFGNSKKAFLIFNLLYTVIGIALVFFCIAILSNKLDVAKMIMLLRKDIFNLLTIGGFGMVAIGLLAFYGAFTHKKYVIIIFMLSLWAIGGVMMAIGYMAYKEVNSFQFEPNMSTLWSTLGERQITIQTKYRCCGYYSDMDRPYITDLCAGFVTSSPTSKRSFVPDFDKVGDYMHDKRQIYDPNPSIVPTIPGCHSVWISFLVTYYQVIYYFAFGMIPFSLIVFVVSILTVNHLYMD